MTVPQIRDKIRTIHTTFPAEWVCLTGGEPLLQPVEGLIQNLATEGFKIQVETNATLFRQLEVDWYTISPKPPDYFFQSPYKKKAKEIKIVVIKGLGFDTLEKLRKDFPLNIPLLLQLESNTEWSATLALKLLRQAMKKGLRNIKITTQIHKIFNWR